MHRFLRLLPLLGFLAATAGCAAMGGGEVGPDNGPVTGETYYTLANLHPDSQNRRLQSLNYQQAALIPLCTEVTIDSRNRKKMLFTITETGVQYEYLLSGHTTIPFPDHLNKFFGKSCDEGRIASMSDVDQQGIQAGRAMTGMSKEGVLIACGPPPVHANPSTESNVWTYWKNRWAKRLIYFDVDGKVSEVQG